ncbi:MAG: TetR/AcrR family transcriptional regulator [Spirochaetota bacterium]
MEKETKTKEQIFQAASKLFYENGYAGTEPTEVLKNSALPEKTFSHYFPTKSDLGIFYITEIQAEVLDVIQKTLDKHPHFDQFILVWIKLIQRTISNDYFLGCPLGNIYSQTYSDPMFKKHIYKTFQSFKFIFIDYFSKNYQLPLLEARELSEEVIALYEGSMKMFAIDNNKKYFDHLRDHLLYIHKRSIGKRSIT